MSTISDLLQQLRENSRFRTIPVQGDESLVDFTSNDYLGLASDTALVDDFFNLYTKCAIPAMTSSASRLLAAHQHSYSSLESLLSELYDGRSALLFNSGYHANTGLISALATEGTMVIADRLVHASIIDGITLSRRPFARFRHNNVGHLRQLLERNADGYQTIIVAVESVYSMDGDCAPLSEIVALKREFANLLIYVDEAHGFGVLGPRGLGLSMGLSPQDRSLIDVIVGTFGKALASVGAFAVASPEIIDWAVNTSRSFIFSTALPPINVCWTEFAIRRMLDMESRRVRLRDLSSQLHSVLTAYSSAPVGPSHIQPLIVGSAKGAVELARDLASAGVKALPIRVPTVPAGTERLRFSLSAALTDDDMSRLKHALDLYPLKNYAT